MNLHIYENRSTAGIFFIFVLQSEASVVYTYTCDVNQMQTLFAKLLVSNTVKNFVRAVIEFSIHTAGCLTVHVFIYLIHYNNFVQIIYVVLKDFDSKIQCA